MALPDAADREPDPAAACVAVSGGSGLSARRDEILEDDDVCHVVVDDVDDEDEDDSPDEFVPTYVLAQEIDFNQAEQEVDRAINIFLSQDIDVIIGDDDE